MVENVGVAAENTSKCISVQKLFLLPVLGADICNFGCQPTSDNAVSDISESGVFGNVRVAAGTASKSISIEKLFLFPVLLAAIVSFGCQPTLGHVVSAIFESGCGGSETAKS